MLYIDEPQKYETVLRSGLLSCPAYFEFCRNDVSLALNKIEEVKPDLIITALEFQEGSVLEFIEKIKSNLSRIPSIYISEPHLLDIQKKLAESTGGTYEIVLRSNEPTELIQKVDQLVRVSREYRKTHDWVCDLRPSKICTFLLPTD